MGEPIVREKKITIKDGLIAVFLIFKYFFSSTYK